MTTSLGPLSLVPPAAASGSDAAQMVVPPTLVDRLADALGVAEARCAEHRVQIQPISYQPSLRVAVPYMPPSFVNAETAPFLVHPVPQDKGPHDRQWADASTGFLAQPPSMMPPPTPALSLFSARPSFSPLPISAPIYTDAFRSGQSFVDPGYSRFAEPGRQAFDADQYDAADLPRFFDVDRHVSNSQMGARKRSSHQLSASTMAIGFAIGIAMMAPVMWVASNDKNSVASKRVTASATGLTTPMLAASTVATLVPSAAFEVAERGGKEPTDAERLELAEAAFFEASRRIAAGDYIGARDQLRQALSFGEDRARALLDALQ